ncbi:unnamed protein product [Clavelina lepadiformis]|uniref:Structural maintenance of chromosomes protein 5 n=1 Tax=Clavelina lepadiformis TaxID=159417 RepID=A0ABP0FL27_CLALP
MDDEQSAVQSNATTTIRRKKNEGFVKGSIIRIALQNFLTYDHCSFRLNPKLNVIIGPNGTGKSSIVCAICLGLGGKTGVLARAKELVDYIKHGCDKAIIEIELCSPPNNYVIRREISQSSNGKATSIWVVNGNQVNVKQVEETVSKLNIKLANLCQFLPQERVADFAKMNKIELLENTELAICPLQMQEDHKWLKDFCNMEKILVINKNEKQSHLDKLVQKNQRVEKEALRFQERQKLISALEVVDQKRAWTIYSEARGEYYKHRDAFQHLKKKYSEAQQKTNPLEKEKDKLTNHMVDIDKNLKKKSEELKAVAAAAKQIHDKINEMDDKAQEKWDDYKEREKDEQMRLKKVEQFKLQISGWQKELEQLEEKNLQSEIDELSSKIRATLTEITHLEHEHAKISEEKRKTHEHIKTCEQKNAELNNLSKKRLEILRRRNKDCYNAIQWLRSNKSKFKSTIHEPIMLLIKMKNPSHAELIESHISMRDMFAFVCEDSDDNKKFIEEVREKQRLRINVVKAPRSNNGDLLKPSSFKPRTNLESLKKWGFTSYLRESFDAPEAVMAFLCKQYRVYDLPIGSAATKSVVDQVTQQSGLTLFYIPTLSSESPGCKYSVRRSKYSSNSIVGNSSLRKAEYLNINIDPFELEQIKQQTQKHIERLAYCAERNNELMTDRRRLEKQDNELKTQKKEILQQKNMRKNLENKIMLKQKNLEDLEKNTMNLEILKAKTQKSVHEVILKKKDFAVKFVHKIKACVDASITKGMTQAEYAHCLRKKTTAEEKIHQMKLENVELQKAAERAEMAKNEAQKRAKDLLAAAKKKTGGIVDEELRNKFNNLPNDLAEIEAKIYEYQARLDCCGETDPKAFDEFEARKKEIKFLESEVTHMLSHLQNKRDEMDKVKKRWLTPLREIISKINSHFSQYFAQMGCAGEVDLHAENENDFGKYGIRIRVKFRSSSSLQELNPFRQSGGERSVSTMLYLVALQSMHTCPFRLVDEINQGMDPNNERRVFEVIVRSSSEESTSQYFLITPKLLPNLTYNRHMSVHCVYNGPKMLPHNAWKVSRFIRRRRMLQYEDDD